MIHAFYGMNHDVRTCRKGQFLSSIRTLVGIAAACRQISFEDAYVVLVVAEVRAKALPEHGLVTQLALELMEAVSKQDDDQGAEDGCRPTWLTDNSVDLEGMGPQEVLLGGRWHICKPEWDDLPGETPLELDLTAALRRASDQTATELALSVDRPRRAVSAALRRLSVAGHVETCTDGGDRWRLSLATMLSLEC